jgi:Ca-activated chloride channel family protein
MSRAGATSTVTVIVAVLSGLSASGQFSYKTGVDVAAFTVTVVDRTGEAVPDLTAQDFEIREEGVQQTVSYFSTATGDAAVPLHIGLLFDTSESMERDMPLSRNAAIRFLNTFPAAADFTLVEFDDEVRAARFSQAQFPRLVERIRSRKARGRTSLYDALSVYLGSAFDQTGRKVLVVYTDGGDTSSSRTWDEALRILRASDVTVYPIGFLASRGSPRLMQQSQLMEIARLTGGRAVFPAAMKDLELMYASIADEIHAQYLIGYVPTNMVRDGKWRKVEIKVTRTDSKRLQLRTRPGYFAPPPQ